MADFSKPGITENYTDVLAAVRDLIAEAIKFQDGSTNTNVPTGSIRFSSTAKRFERYNGTSWTELIAKATDKYDINVDRVDGFDAGNASGNIPVSNGTLNTNLNADLLGGARASNLTGAIPLSNGTVNVNLNADKLDGFDAGNGTGQVPVSNGVVNTNLNAQLLGGRQQSELVLAPPQGQGGVRNLYRSDDASSFYVAVTYETGGWRLNGYDGAGAYHDKVRVGYADVAATASTSNNTNSIAGAVGGAYSWSGRQSIQRAGQAFTATGSQGNLEVNSVDAGAAIMAFHRPGLYAAYFGLDTDNQFKWGGWSGGGPHTFWTTANLNPANYAPNTHGHATYLVNAESLIITVGNNSYRAIKYTRADGSQFQVRTSQDYINDAGGGGGGF